MTFIEDEVDALGDALSYFAGSNYGGRLPEDDDWSEMKSVVDRLSGRVEQARDRMDK